MPRHDAHSARTAFKAFHTEAFVTADLKRVLLHRPHVVELVLRHLRHNCGEPIVLRRL